MFSLASFTGVLSVPKNDTIDCWTPSSPFGLVTF